MQVFACTDGHPGMQGLVITNDHNIAPLLPVLCGNVCSISTLTAGFLSRFLGFAAGF